jgi:hypothetical protein
MKEDKARKKRGERQGIRDRAAKGILSDGYLNQYRL